MDHVSGRVTDTVITISQLEFMADVSLNSCHTLFSRQSHGVQGKCRSPRCAQYDRKHFRSNAMTSSLDAVGSNRTPTDGAQFEHAQNKRRGNAALKERSGVAVWSP